MRTRQDAVDLDDRVLVVAFCVGLVGHGVAGTMNAPADPVLSWHTLGDECAARGASLGEGLGVALTFPAFGEKRRPRKTTIQHQEAGQSQDDGRILTEPCLHFHLVELIRAGQDHIFLVRVFACAQTQESVFELQVGALEQALCHPLLHEAWDSDREAAWSTHACAPGLRSLRPCGVD